MRIDTVRRVAAENGVPFGDDRISYGDFWSVPAIKATEEVIASGHLPQAIICANDVMAIAVCETLNNHGVRIPEDIMVTGFDGIKEIMFNSPKITSSRCDFAALGRAAAGAVIKYDREGADGDVVIKPEVFVSESCGCAERTSIDAAKQMMQLNNMYYRYQDEYRSLQTITADTYGSEDADVLEERLRNGLFYNMMCILRAECLDPSVDPMKPAENTGDLRVLYDHNKSYTGKDRRFCAKDIVPDIEGIFGAGFPIIFEALNNTNIPLGFVCFYYTDVDKTNYLKMGQIRACLNSSVIAYRDMHYQHYLQQRIEQMYKYDDLTGMYTRNGFDREAERILSGEHGAVTLVICDLDGLKYINDTFGHSEGDNAIYEVSRALIAACGRGICSKYGGDELIALLDGSADESDIKRTVRDTLERYNSSSDKPYNVSASVGVYVSDGSEPFNKMFSEADMRMYAEKSAKKRAL